MGALVSSQLFGAFVQSMTEIKKNWNFPKLKSSKTETEIWVLISGSFMHANRGFAPHRGPLLQSGAGRRRWLRSSVSSSDTQQKRWNRDDAQNGKNLRKFHKTTSRLESPPMRFAMGFKSILKGHSYFHAHIFTRNFFTFLSENSSFALSLFKCSNMWNWEAGPLPDMTEDKVRLGICWEFAKT